MAPDHHLAPATLSLPSCTAWVGLGLASALAAFSVVETLTVNVYFHRLFRICLHLKVGGGWGVVGVVGAAAAWGRRWLGWFVGRAACVQCLRGGASVGLQAQAGVCFGWCRWGRVVQVVQCQAPAGDWLGWKRRLAAVGTLSSAAC